MHVYEDYGGPSSKCAQKAAGLIAKKKIKNKGLKQKRFTLKIFAVYVA